MTTGDSAVVPLVVCLPHGGGVAATFAGWCAALDGEADLVAIEYPGHGTRASEPMARSMGQIVADAFALLQTFAGRPLLIFGHSLGAVVAYELARMMEAADRLLLGVVVSACRPPQLAPWTGPATGAPAEGESDRDHSSHRAIAAMRGLGDVPSILLGDDAYRQRTSRLVAADSALLEGYVHEPEPVLAAPVLAMGGAADPVVDSAALARWLDLTSGGGEVLIVQGGHFYHLRQRAVVTAALSRWLKVRTATPEGRRNSI